MSPRCRSLSLILPLALVASGASAEQSIVQFPSLTMEAALKTATAAMGECRKQGALVAVAVTDRAGNVLALLRDPLAGMHTVDTASRKAWTAISFRNPTSALEKATGPTTASSGIRHLPGVAMIGGGLPIEAAGALVGAIGISGAPSGELDEACGKVGIDAIQADLEMGS